MARVAFVGLRDHIFHVLTMVEIRYPLNSFVNGSLDKTIPYSLNETAAAIGQVEFVMDHASSIYQNVIGFSTVFILSCTGQISKSGRVHGNVNDISAS